MMDGNRMKSMKRKLEKKRKKEKLWESHKLVGRSLDAAKKKNFWETEGYQVQVRGE